LRVLLLLQPQTLLAPVANLRLDLLLLNRFLLLLMETLRLLHLRLDRVLRPLKWHRRLLLVYKALLGLQLMLLLLLLRILPLPEQILLLRQLHWLLSQ